MGELRPIAFSVNIKRNVVILAILLLLGCVCVCMSVCVCVCVIDPLFLNNCLSAHLMRFNYSHPFMVILSSFSICKIPLVSSGQSISKKKN
jgi:hypothetical protein